MLQFIQHIRYKSILKFGLLIVIYLFMDVTAYPQQLSTTSKKAVKAYQAGLDFYNKRQYTQAIDQLKNAIKSDKVFLEAYLLTAESYMELGDLPKAKDAFLECLAINPGFFPPVFYSVADIEFELGEYENASKHLEQFLTYTNQKPAIKTKAERLLASSNFADKAVKNPVPFQPEDIGLQFGYDQYWPSLSVDEQTLVFTGLVPKDSTNKAVTGNRQEDFFVSVNRNGKWTKPLNMGSPPNTSDNEGAQAISADVTRMFFTACNRNDGHGGCDIYYSERRGELWTRPVNLHVVNTSAKETQPSVSVDGRTLYFVSNRAGGKGGQDIWASVLDEKGAWGKPFNISEINTTEDESSPFIHPDDQTLYFASSGWPGMGQFDLFVSRKDSSDKWSEPLNLGYPINTRHNEEGLIVNARGDRAYYSSDRGDSQTRRIYTFELYPEVRPQPVSYMKGKIYDAKYLKPLRARFELIDLSTSDKVIESLSDSTSGEFLVCIPSGKNYGLNVSRKGYLFYSEHFTLDAGTYKEPYHKDIALKRIQPGEKVILENVFFEFNSHKLLDESKAELQQVVRFLKENPSIKIRITGHTDNIGKVNYNLELSQNRARAVANYLLNEGIALSRVSYKGMGSSESVATNATEEGRAQNRRTELNIIK